jgi:hypothetical protein
MEAAALSDAASIRGRSRVGEGDRDGMREELAEAGVRWPEEEEKEESESERKKGEEGRSSGEPSSSAYSSCEIFAPGTQFCGASVDGRINVNSNLDMSLLYTQLVKIVIPLGPFFKPNAITRPSDNLYPPVKYFMLFLFPSIELDFEFCPHTHPYGFTPHSSTTWRHSDLELASHIQVISRFE